MTCPKCNNAMSDTSSFSVKSYICIYCGNCVYPAYPLRPAPTNNCDACGEEFEKNKNYVQKYCPKCRKLLGKNFNKLKHHMRAIKAKRLRREAEKLTQRIKPSSTMKLRKLWTGKTDEKGKIYKTLTGSVRHAEGTTRRVYQDLKNA